MYSRSKLFAFIPGTKIKRLTDLEINIQIFLDILFAVNIYRDAFQWNEVYDLYEMYFKIESLPRARSHNTNLARDLLVKTVNMKDPKLVKNWYLMFRYIAPD